MDISAKKAKSLKNAEKRRERSKVAARCRRGKESEIFNDMSEFLPIPEASKAALDKASVMRLTLCHLKLKQMMDSNFKIDELEGVCSNEEFDSLVNNALGGFVLAFTLEGDVIYASEGITTELGICQYEIMGQSIFDFSHQYDHNDIRALLAVKKGEDDQNWNQRSGLFRMKCTVSSRGRNAHMRTANYKVVNCIGRITVGDSSSDKWFISICEPLLHPSDVDIPLNKQTFLSKHTSDMKFEYIDDSVASLLGYKPEDMLGKSLFEFNHAADGDRIAKSFKSLYEKDQNQTDRYRFLTKGGGWIWVITQATVIHGANAKTPNSIVCIHFITSGREEKNMILSEVQMGEQAIPAEVSVPAPLPLPVARKVLSESKLNIPVVQLNSIPFKKIHAMNTDEENDFITELLTGPMLNNATCSTSKIFAPKTKDMDTGFLMPIDENTLIVSKEEPEDLTHLAPIAGDECVPLEIPLLEDLLASLDEANLEYSILDPYSDEIPNFDFSSFSKSFSPKMEITKSCSYDNNQTVSASMLIQSDPPVRNSAPESSLSDYSYRCCSPSTQNSYRGPGDICCSAPLLNHMKDPFLSSGGLSTSPLPPEISGSDITDSQHCLALMPTSSSQLSQNSSRKTVSGISWSLSPNDRIITNPSLPVKPPEADPNQIKNDSTDIENRYSSLGTIAQSIPQDNVGSDWKMVDETTDTDLRFDPCGIGIKNVQLEVTGPTPTKMTKLVPIPVSGPSDKFGSEDNDPGPEPSRIYILVPVTRRRSSSVESVTGLTSSESDSNDSGSGSFDLVDLVQNKSTENAKLRAILESMGVELDTSTFLRNSSTTVISKPSAAVVSQRVRKRDFAGSLLCDRPVSLHELTRQDCEVNAPLSTNSELLQGPELLSALEVCGIPNVMNTIV